MTDKQNFKQALSLTNIYSNTDTIYNELLQIPCKYFVTDIHGINLGCYFFKVYIIVWQDKIPCMRALESHNTT